MNTKTSSPLTQQSMDVASRCANFSVRRSMRALNALYDDALKPCGLKGTQFTVLNAIEIMQKPTINQLADALLMDRTTLTRNLKPLETQRFIERISGEDRRTKTLSLTHSGKAVLRQGIPLWNEAQTAVEQLLGETRLKRLRKDLRQLETLAS